VEVSQPGASTLLSCLHVVDAVVEVDPTASVYASEAAVKGDDLPEANLYL
jgi:hypothetical protein